MGGSSAYIDHADAVGSTTMETDPAGGLQWDIVYFPWGQIWQQTGIRQSAVFADLDWQVNDPLQPSATREYSGNVNRWMTPDPGGRSVVRLDNPQTWNMYAYVGNNPTTLNDPAGLQPDSPFTFVPNNFCYGFSCVKRFGSMGESTGVTVQGDDIFDALEGSPGTYVYFNQSGNLNFGFSEDLWINEELQSEEQFRNSAVYRRGISNQGDTVNTNLAKDFPSSGAHVISGDPIYVAGGHANFRVTCGSANGGNCAGRWRGGLHVETNGHGKYWGHNDTRSYYIGARSNWTTFNLGNLVVHATVDVIYGHLGNYIFPY